MLTKPQLKAAQNKGDLETVYKECRRYGVVNYQEDVEITRYVYITYKDLYWEFELEKGEVVSAGWNVTPSAVH